MSKKQANEPARSRERVGHTQAQAAEMIGVARRTWQDWEAGVAHMPEALLMLYRHLAGLKRIPFKGRAS
jgi:DNA-binding XRE family transcriptional regulator